MFFTTPFVEARPGTQWQQAFQLLQLLQLQQVEANLVTFNASISCLERVAKWTAALGVLQQISQDETWVRGDGGDGLDEPHKMGDKKEVVWRKVG